MCFLVMVAVSVIFSFRTNLNSVFAVGNAYFNGLTTYLAVHNLHLVYVVARVNLNIVDGHAVWAFEGAAFC